MTLMSCAQTADFFPAISLYHLLGHGPGSLVKKYICNSYFIRTCLCPNIHTQLPIAVAFVLSYFMPRHAVCNLRMRAGMVLAVVAFHWTIWWSINRLMWI